MVAVSPFLYYSQEETKFLASSVSEGGDAMEYISLSELLEFCMVILGVIDLCIQIKKK